MVDYVYGEGDDGYGDERDVIYGWWGLVISLMTFKWYNTELFWSLGNFTYTKCLDHYT
jgi:hypothetical protein